MTGDNKSTYLKGILFACITAMLWGFLAIGLKVAVMEIPTLNIIWFRFVVAFGILFIYFLVWRPKDLSIIIKPPWKLIVAAVCLGINYFGFNEGVNYTSPSSAQVFIQSGPLLLALAGLVIFKEKISWKQGLGFLLAILGFVLFYSQQVNFSEGNNYTIGMLLLLLGGVSWAAYSVFQKQLVKTWHVQRLNLLIYGIPVLLYTPLVDYSNFSGISFGYWVLLVALGVNTLIAYGSLAMALKYLEANKVSIIITLNPVITFVAMAIIGVAEVSWIAKENFTMPTIIGALMVLAGALIVLSLRRGGRTKK